MFKDIITWLFSTEVEGICVTLLQRCCHLLFRIDNSIRRISK